MLRVDAIPTRRLSMRAIGGDVLADGLDDVLQQLVEEACRELQMPIALVSLVLDRVQLFRAHYGLPPDLAAVRATDRDASFCQFVVRDQAMFEVEDAMHDERVPQELVARYGIAAYLGAPVSVAGEVIGSLCTIDLTPRTFSEANRGQISRLAALVSTRLTELAVDKRELQRTLHAGAVRPVFSELRNLLVPAIATTDAMRIAMVELGVLRRLAAYAGPLVGVAGTLDGALRAIDEIEKGLEELEGVVHEIHMAVVALERASIDTTHCSIADVIVAATTLAHHRSKLVNGVRWIDADRLELVALPRTVAVTCMSVAISALASELQALRSSAGIEGRVTAVNGFVVVTLEAPGVAAERIKRHVASLAFVAGDEWIELTARAAAIELRYATVPAPPTP